MKRSNLPPQIHAAYQRFDAYRKQLGVGYDQLLWAGFVLITGMGLFVTAWPNLSMVSAMVLIVFIAVIAWAGWNWQALQITVAILVLLVVLILFSGLAQALYFYLGMTSLVLLIGGLLMLVLLESGKVSLTYQHVGLVLWATIIGCLLMVIIRWLERPAIGLKYAGLPLANSVDSSLLLLSSLLLMFILFLRRQLRGNTNYLIIVPGIVMGAYILPDSMQTGTEQSVLPPAVLEQGLILLHVPSMVLAFALLILASGYALLRLISGCDWFRARQNKDVMETIHINLEGTQYRMVTLATILLGTGILSGMFWSSLAWGHYWLWEPKQLISIALWFYYLAILHLRLQKGMQDRAFAMLCLLGLPLLTLTWFGTNLWLEGLHNFSGG